MGDLPMETPDLGRRFLMGSAPPAELRTPDRGHVVSPLSANGRPHAGPAKIRKPAFHPALILYRYQMVLRRGNFQYDNRRRSEDWGFF